MYVLNTFLKHLLNVQFKFLILVFIPSKWLSSPLGCRPARDHPDVYRTSGSGRVRLVSERGLFRTYLGSSVTIVVCQLWRHLDVVISEIGAIWHSGANLPCLDYHLRDEILKLVSGLCLIDDVFGGWTTFSIWRYFTTCLPREWRVKSVLLGIDVFEKWQFKKVWWRSVVDRKWGCHSATCVP